MDLIFGWFELHPGLAAWVQAVFSVVAILAAWLITRYEDGLREMRQDLGFVSALRSLAHRQHGMHGKLERLLRYTENCQVDRRAYLQSWVMQVNALRDFPMAALPAFHIIHLVELRESANAGYEAAQWLHTMADQSGDIDYVVLAAAESAMEKTSFALELLQHNGNQLYRRCG